MQEDGGTSSALLLPSGAIQEQPETPCPDSLPSTPRADEQENEAEETPCPFADLTTEVHADPMEQDAEEPTPGAPVTLAAAAGQPVGAGGTN